MHDTPALRADLVLHNGKIATMDAAGTNVEAVAMSGERIVATGTTAELDPLVAAETRVIDLEHRVVLPGFIDTHVHLDCAASHTKLATSCHIPPVDYVAVVGSTGSRGAILDYPFG